MDGIGLIIRWPINCNGVQIRGVSLQKLHNVLLKVKNSQFLKNIAAIHLQIQFTPVMNMATEYLSVIRIHEVTIVNIGKI